MTPVDHVSQVKESMAQLTDREMAPSDLSLTNCDREPIHIPNSIQPHGILLTFSEDFNIRQVSQNCEVFLGRKPEAFLEKPLSSLMGPEQIDIIQGCLNNEFENVNPLRLNLSVEGETRVFEGVVHQVDGVTVLELEPSTEQQAVSFFDFYKFVKAPIDKLQKTQTLSDLSQQAVAIIQTLTGFERVMLYRFAQDGSGHVIAEAKPESSESFLGLHYPASDVPKQAKQLYRLNLLRLIPDASYEQVPLEPQLNPVTNAPLDLSLSVLRSVSPIHREYLHNMDVCASMSISLLRDRQLWGLIACHHPAPKRLSYETRTICEFLGQIISFEIGSKSDTEEIESKLTLQTVLSTLVNSITHAQTLGDGFCRNPQHLMELCSATGVVFCENNEIATFGNTPPPDQIPDLLSWIDTQLGSSALYSTTNLTVDYPQFASHKNIASGLLALRISSIHKTYILWFRPEVIQTIHWGGDPTKSIEAEEENGSLRMTPRKSFELWKQTVQLKSLPWQPWETNAALELRSSIIGIVLQKADELAALNIELERSNIELDSFAYIASHDLKEPLRGIYNYSAFLIEDYNSQLDEEGRRKLSTLMQLTQRMEDLINSLLHYAAFGRTELNLQPVDLQELTEKVLETIKISHPTPIEFRIPRPLPTLSCDRTLVTELLTNLISNAIKYNDQEHKWVEIGYISPNETNQASFPQSIHAQQTIFFVKDNGIGIRDKHLETIFKIFKRLHAANNYGGGTGAGLTIAKKVVERHGGSIAVESNFGEGSTFYFTLGQAT